MKEKLLKHFYKCKIADKERLVGYISHFWETAKKHISKYSSKTKKITIEEFIKYFLYFGFAVIGIWAIIYLYEVFFVLGIIGVFLYLLWKQNERDEKDKIQKMKEETLLIEKKKRENENKLTQLKYRFNAPIAKIVNYSFNQYVLVSEEQSLIMINERIYTFSDIINFSLSDNSIEVFSPTTSKTKTNTGSMVGRAIVGGVLTGGVGAIIGGVTAGKTTETIGGTSRTEHNYTLMVTVNNISNPIERIYLGEESDCANELCSLFSIILNRRNC